MVAVVLSLVGLVSVPILLSLAWSGWARKLRGELPRWRSGVSLSALLVLSLHWSAVAVLELPVILLPQAHRSAALMEGMLTLSHPLDVVVVGLAFALRGLPRLQTVLAGLLMLISWPAGYV